MPECVFRDASFQLKLSEFVSRLGRAQRARATEVCRLALDVAGSINNLTNLWHNCMMPLCPLMPTSHALRACAAAYPNVNSAPANGRSTRGCFARLTELRAGPAPHARTFFGTSLHSPAASHPLRAP